MVPLDVHLCSHQNSQQVPAPGSQAERSPDNPSVARDSTSSFNQQTTDWCQVCLATLVNLSRHKPCCVQCPWLRQPGRWRAGHFLILAEGHCQGDWSVPITPLTLLPHSLFSLNLMNMKSKMPFGFCQQGTGPSYLRPIFLQGFTTHQITPVRVAGGQSFRSLGAVSLSPALWWQGILGFAYIH